MGVQGVVEVSVDIDKCRGFVYSIIGVWVVGIIRREIWENI